MASSTSLSGNGNVNLRLSHVTIDDVVRRAALNSGVSPGRVEEDFPTLKDQYGRRVFGGKVVLVRPDLNSPFLVDKEGRYVITDTERIGASAPTIREFSDYGAKVVIIAHQGRPGEEDCISLEPHKKVLEDLLGRNVSFRHAHWYGAATQTAIQEMRGGAIFLLDNIRKLADEMLSGGDDPGGKIDPRKFANLPDSFPKVLGNLADYFVNDGFSVSHRWHGSVAGFPYILNIAGRLMEREIIANRALSADTLHPYTMLLGGVKITDYLGLVKESLDGRFVDHVLAAGALGIIGVLGTIGGGNTNYLGERTVRFLKEKGVYSQLDTVAGLAGRYPGRFILPLDFKVELDGQTYIMTPGEINAHPDKDRMNLYGIGPKTVARFRRVLEKSKTVYLKGTPTKVPTPEDNDDRFLPESRELIGIVVRLTRQGAMTILTGGDTTALVNGLGYSPERDFKTRTLAGGAATQYRVGEILPGLYMLNTSYNAFNGLPLNSGLGSYQLGFEPVAPRIPELLRPR